MNRDKQIEKMNTDIEEARREFKRLANHILLFYGDEMPKRENYFCATYLIDGKGYRKASDVAREMCGMLRDDLRGFVDADYLERLLTIYEKKYTEGEG